MDATQTHFDAIFLGGGLASCLSAIRLREARPQARIAIIERDQQICGNHTWCFHGPDVSPAASQWLAPMLAHSWDRQQVLFPQFHREIETSYHAVTSDSLRCAVERSSLHVVTGSEATVLQDSSIELSDGRGMTANCVFDGRGFAPHPSTQLGYQKFLGLEIELNRPHNQTMPTIMDATPAQLGGYRFVYVLPLSPTRLLVEDTYYSDDQALDHKELEDRINAYISAKDWSVASVVRREHGVLPIALAFDSNALLRDLPDNTVPIGLRAHLFHHVTGYSLPFAVQTAERLAATKCALTTKNMRAVLETQIHNSGREQAYFRLLNRMLFRAAVPDQRYRVLQRFYGLPNGLIERFFAGRLTFADKLRLLVGKPPVPISKAIGCLREYRAV